MKFNGPLALTIQSAPVSPANGWLYYDTSAKRIETYDGSSWNKYIALVDLQSGGINATFNTAVIGGTTTFAGNFGIANALAPTFQVVPVGNPDTTQVISTTPGASGNTFGTYPITVGARTNSAAGAWSTTAMSSGDVLWAEAAIGDAGSGTNGGGQTGGYWQWVCDSAWTNAHYPTRIELYLCSSSSTTPAKVLSITPDGFLSPNYIAFQSSQSSPGAAASGKAFAYESSTLGLVLYGNGSLADVALANRSGSFAMVVSPNTTTCTFAAMLSSSGGYGGAYNAIGVVTATCALNFGTGANQSFQVTASTACTVSVSVAPSLPCDVTITVKGPASGTTPTITWPATFKGFPANVTTAKTSTLRAHYDGTNYLLIGSQQNY